MKSQKWYYCTPPTISSLASNPDGGEAKNFYALRKCWDYKIDPKLFSSRPTEEEIIAMKNKQIKKSILK